MLPNVVRACVHHSSQRAEVNRGSTYPLQTWNQSFRCPRLHCMLKVYSIVEWFGLLIDYEVSPYEIYWWFTRRSSNGMPLVVGRGIQNRKRLSWTLNVTMSIRSKITVPILCEQSEADLLSAVKAQRVNKHMREVQQKTRNIVLMSAFCFSQSS